MSTWFCIMAANDELQKFAQEAIENINRMTALLETNRTVNVATTSSSNLSALSELQRRFPTFNATRSSTTARATLSNPRYRSRSAAGRFHPYQTGTVGRPRASQFATHDVIVIENGQERIPTKSEKIELERNQRVISGFDIDRSWDAEQLYNQLSSLLKGTELEDLNFEIVKNCAGTLVTPNIPPGKKVDSNLLFKSIAPSGNIFIRLLEDLPHVNKQIEDMLSKSIFDSDGNDDEVIVVGQQSSSTTSSSTSTTSYAASGSNEGDEKIQSSTTVTCPFDIESIVDKAKALQLEDPVETLRFLQLEINQGRALDMSVFEETLEGEANMITVNRGAVLQSTFSDLEFIDNYRLPFSVDFMGEECADLGGPQKEWIRLVNKAIKKKYFDQGLRKFLAKDYFFVGVMIGVAMLQNGQLPTYVEEQILQEILSQNKNDSSCVHEIQRGLETLGMLSALRQLPMLAHLLRPGAHAKLTVPILLHLLKPVYSEEGSNAFTYEKEVYQLFVRYAREVASGRRICGERKLELSNILEFVTGASNEPPLGFVMPPKLQFVIPNEYASFVSAVPDRSASSVIGGFTPTAHTCGNVLSLPRGTHQLPLPAQEKLFSIYDMAFSQDYFGRV